MTLLFGKEINKFFPLKSIQEVVKFVKFSLEKSDPDLALLSIVLGFIENTLTSNRLTATTNDSQQIDFLTNFPVVNLELVETLYKKFQTILTTREIVHKHSTKATRQNIQNKDENSDETTRDIIKKINDIIWFSLLKSSQKDRAHLQSVYSYLNESKLDCFGVGLTTLAGCQLLGYKDVNLALSEDHVWLVFGKTGGETIEITWHGHGKGSEDKRGQAVGLESQTWIYVNGFPVVCNRFMEVAAMVSAINPSLTQTSACLEVADMQQQLLWMLYDLNALSQYPMALSCLAELEEVSPTSSRPSSEELYTKSVLAGRKFYKNHHVYPSIALAGYYYRKSNYKKAFSAWADAGDVIRLYNYSRDDEEIYKEFLDIANEIIPLIMKTESSGHSGKSILRDSHCFANLLRFYDGICVWEEGSLTPILHIGWAKPLVQTISKFDFDIRSQIVIKCASDDDYNELISQSQQCVVEKKADTADLVLGNKSPDSQNNNNNNNIVKTDEDEKSINATAQNQSKNVLSRLEALTAACGEKILNPDFLLQGGDKPFTTTSTDDNLTEKTKTNGSTVLVDDFKAEIVETKEKGGSETNSNAASTETTKPIIENLPMLSKVAEENSTETAAAVDIEDAEPKRPVITLFSHKMKALKDLLLAEKLNTNAISLQITAQSQVQVGGKKSRSHGGGGANAFDSVEGSSTRSSKRARRD